MTGLTKAPTDFEDTLRSNFRGDISFRDIDRGIHASDASHYQIMPLGVAWPMDEDDVLAALKTAHQFAVPVTARGAATSLSGQTHGPGLIIDCSRYMDAVLEIDPAKKTARVQPAVIRDLLNQELASEGLMFAPDPATGNRATVGGMIGNNTSGARSVVHGKTSDQVISLKVALIDGTVLKIDRLKANQWQEKCEAGGREGEIYSRLTELIETNEEEIRARFPKVMRRVAGYALDAFLPEHETRSLADIIIGSEGTLAFILEATLNLVPVPKHTALCVIHFDAILDSLRRLEEMLEFGPTAIELLDDVILSEARVNPATAHCAGFFIGKPEALLIVEFCDDSAEAVKERADSFAKTMQDRDIGYASPVMLDAKEQADVWETRKLGLGLISNVKGATKGQAFIEDACVPLPELPDYIEKVQAICERENLKMAMYAHASVGVLHLRPMLDLHREEDIAKMRRIAEECFELVKEKGGAWSGEHGDGLVRGEFIAKFFGEQITEAFAEVKRIFDPDGLMNPGKMIKPGSMTENLRYGISDYEEKSAAVESRTDFRYADQGGFVLAVEQCNGVGACRKLGSGTMCPSYMATKDESHSTRGRANALRLAMSGQFGDTTVAMAGDDLHETLALCLACKACKQECPNAVDLARLKSETLQMRHDVRGVPLGTWMIDAMPKMARLVCGPVAPLVNFFQTLSPTRWLLEKMTGIDTRRKLPAFAKLSLHSHLKGRKWAIDGDREKVVLYADTYTRFYEPEVGIAAIELLENCGYCVEVPELPDSQRARLSKGLVRRAKEEGTLLLQQLDQWASKDIPLLFLEPSCASSVADDLPDLIDDIELGKRVAGQVKLIDRFLEEEGIKLQSKFGHLLIHGHCHQKALFGEPYVNGLINGENSSSNAGCCGMAGTFGYEHYDVSQAVGEDRLFPAVTEAMTEHGSELAVVANGISCRHQLRDYFGEDLRALHFVQAVESG